ncbi:MAG: hypothetical protein AB1609_21585 [Bacillota bacterium]
MLTSPDIITAHGQRCFYCGKPTEDPAVEWHGYTAQIFLHPACAVDLLLRLARDVWEFECRHHTAAKLPRG